MATLVSQPNSPVRFTELAESSQPMLRTLPALIYVSKVSSNPVVMGKAAFTSIALVFLIYPSSDTLRRELNSDTSRPALNCSISSQ